MKLGKKGYSILFAVLFLVLLAVMDYPFLARLVNEVDMSGVSVDYRESLNGAEQELERMRREAAAYNQSLLGRYGNELQDAFSEQGMGNGDEQYEQLLNPGGTGIMGMILIPKINVSLPVYHGTSEDVLQSGAGHLEGSSLPVGGENTHACISAHRGLPSKRLFTRMDEMGEGDLFFLEILGEKMAYRIIDVRTVNPDDVESLEIRPGEDLVTLITCTPYGINSHRLFVTGERAEYSEELYQAEVSRARWGNWIKEWWWAVLTGVLLCVMVYLLYRLNRRTGSGKRKQAKNRKKSETRKIAMTGSHPSGGRAMEDE